MQCPDPVTAFCSCYEAPRSSGIPLIPSVVWVTFVVKTSADQCLLCRANKSADDLLSRLLGAQHVAEATSHLSDFDTGIYLTYQLAISWLVRKSVCLSDPLRSCSSAANRASAHLLHARELRGQFAVTHRSRQTQSCRNCSAGAPPPLIMKPVRTPQC